jgi:hypothetical protein
MKCARDGKVERLPGSNVAHERTWKTKCIYSNSQRFNATTVWSGSLSMRCVANTAEMTKRLGFVKEYKSKFTSIWWCGGMPDAHGKTWAKQQGDARREFGSVRTVSISRQRRGRIYDRDGNLGTSDWVDDAPSG